MYFKIIGMKNSIAIANNIVQNEFKDKKDRGGRPYIEHLLAVERGIPSDLLDNDLQCIALLHDLLEDCESWSEEKLNEIFNRRIVSGVVCLTHLKSESYDDYINRIIMNPDAITVKLSDLQHNMDMTRLNEITDKDIDRLKKYHQYYKKLKQYAPK